MFVTWKQNSRLGVLFDSDSNLRQEIDGFLKETKYFENYPENEKGREEAEEEGCVMSS